MSRDPQPMVYNPSCITSFRRSPVNPESTLITLETPQDYIQLWQQPPDSQHHLYLQVNTWPSREQTTMQDQATWPQVFHSFLLCPPAQVKAFCTENVLSPDQHGPLPRKAHTTGVRSVCEIQISKLSKFEGGCLYDGGTHTVE